MSAEQFAALTQQHVDILARLEQTWLILVAIIFFGLLFLIIMMFLAAWSVHRVNVRQGDLEGKFALLVDVLLKTEAERGGRT